MSTRESNLLDFAQTNCRLQDGYMYTTEIARKFLGKNINLRIKYNQTGNKVEIISITTKDFSPQWTKETQWITVKASKSELNSIIKEILGEIQ